MKKVNNQKITEISNPFIDFFEKASLKEKNEVFDRIIEGANKDQRKILKEYDNRFSK